jgi:hypothetical protein
MKGGYLYFLTVLRFLYPPNELDLRLSVGGLSVGGLTVEDEDEEEDEEDEDEDEDGEAISLAPASTNTASSSSSVGSNGIFGGSGFLK